MAEGRPAVRRPWWVRVGLWKISGRSSAWLYVWLSVALALACIVAGLWDRRFFAGTLCLLAALWYLLAIRWVDQHGGWS